MKSKIMNLSFQNSMFNSMLAGSDECVCILDLEYCYKIFNSRHKQLMNEIKNSEIQIGDSFLESFNEHRLKTEFEELLKKSFNGKRFKVNQKMFSNGRTNSIFENTFIPVLDHSKTAIGVIIISKQKLLNQNGSDSKKNNLPPAVVKQVNSKNPFNVDAELFNYTLNSLTQGVVITDKEGVIVWANKAVKNITGYEISELIGQTPGIFKSEVHNSSFYENLWQTIQNGKTWKGEIVNRKKDDSFYFEEMVITPVINENSEVTHYIAFKQDITEKRQKEKEQQKDAASISIIVDKVPAVLWMVDADLMFVSSQGSGLQQMDLKPNQIVGMTVYEFFGTKDREHPPIKAHLQALKGISEQFMLKWKDEIFEAQVEPLKNEDNKIVGCVGIAHNVTDRLKYEKALIESREKAEQSNKLKSEFLAQMSHEIRTPLNVMISAANLLEEENEDMDEDVSLSFQLINSSGSRIIRTIDLLLNMSELHTGTYDFIQEKFDLKTDVLEQVFENYLSKAEAKGLSLQFSCETDETTISGDRYSVLEIFSNLVDNAIKYTENGKVEIIIDKDESKNLAVFVVDTGIGISKEYLPHLFEKFSQEDEGYTRKYEGNGLGLALVREYCTLNNAVLEVESEKGKGSIFKVLFH